MLRAMVEVILLGGVLLIAREIRAYRRMKRASERLAALAAASRANGRPL